MQQVPAALSSFETLIHFLFLITVDGIALGAAATTSHAAVEMIVFLAIMLHKVSHIYLFFSIMPLY